MASTTLAASSNTVVTTGWTNPTNAYGTSADGTLATATPAKNATVNSDYGFASFGLPSGAVISSVVINVGWKLSTSSALGTLGVQGRNNGVADSNAEVTDTTDTTTTTKTFTFGTLPSVTDLNTAGRVVARVRDSRGNTNTAHTGSLDFVSMTVTYTVVDVFSGSINGVASVSAGFTVDRPILPAAIRGRGYVAGTGPLYPSSALYPGSMVLPNFGSAGLTVTSGGGTTKLFSGTINGVATVSAAVVRIRALTATVNGVATVTASVVRTRALTAVVNGVATVSAAIVRTRTFTPTINGVASVSAGVVRTRTFTPTVNGVATVNGAIVRIRSLSPTVSGSSSVSATVSVGATTVSPDRQDMAVFISTWG